MTIRITTNRGKTEQTEDTFFYKKRKVFKFDNFIVNAFKKNYFSGEHK